MTEDKAANEQLALEGCGMTGPELPFGRRGRLVAERLYTAPITAGFGVRVAHEVTDEAFAAGRGEYEALCGYAGLLALADEDPYGLRRQRHRGRANSVCAPAGHMPADGPVGARTPIPHHGTGCGLPPVEHSGTG